VAYLNDNNDTIFSDQTSLQDSGGNSLFGPGLLQVQYVPNPKVFHSPFDKRPDTAGTGSSAIMSYGVNTNIIKRPAQPGPGDFDGNWTKLSAASQLIYMAPSVDPGNKDLAFLNQIASQPDVLAVPSAAASHKDYRGTHNNRGQINALYADGHVVSVSYKEYSTTSGTDDDQKRWKPIYP
jgi:prepilin-type processing-associated H-X9-DG protein